MAYNNSASITNKNIIGIDVNMAKQLANYLTSDAVNINIAVDSGNPFTQMFWLLKDRNGWHTAAASAWAKDVFWPAMDNLVASAGRLYAAFYTAVINDINLYARSIGLSDIKFKTIQVVKGSYVKTNLDATIQGKTIINTQLPELIKKEKSRINIYKDYWTKELKNILKYNPVIGSTETIDIIYKKALVTLNSIEKLQLDFYDKMLKKITDEVAKMQAAQKRAQNAVLGK